MENTVTVQSMLSTAATNLATQLQGIITNIGPIVLGVVVSVIALTAGLALFKKLTGKAH